MPFLSSEVQRFKFWFFILSCLDAAKCQRKKFIGESPMASHSIKFVMELCIYIEGRERETLFFFLAKYQKRSTVNHNSMDVLECRCRVSIARSLIGFLSLAHICVCLAWTNVLSVRRVVTKGFSSAIEIDFMYLFASQRFMWSAPIKSGPPIRSLRITNLRMRILRETQGCGETGNTQPNEVDWCTVLVRSFVRHKRRGNKNAKN